MNTADDLRETEDDLEKVVTHFGESEAEKLLAEHKQLPLEKFRRYLSQRIMELEINTTKEK